MKDKLILLLVGRCRPQIIGMGRHTVAISIAVLIAAPATPFALTFPQWPPGMLRSQLKTTGLHSSKLASSC